MQEFVGELQVFDKRGEGDQVVHEKAVLELCDVTKSGMVEIGFTLRKERVYVSLPLPALMLAITYKTGEAE
jgi:hypothetical protein